MSFDQAKAVLGFPPNSSPTPDEVKAAYRSKAFENHPDRGGSNDKLVEINVAKEILDGKYRAQGGPGSSREWHRPDDARRKQEAENVAKEKARQQSISVSFEEAKHKDLPTNVEWKFRSKAMYSNPTKYVEEKLKGAHTTTWVVYGQSPSQHFFALVQRAAYNVYADGYYTEWDMSPQKAYPLSADLLKIAPAAIKSLVSEGRLGGAPIKSMFKFVEVSGPLTPTLLDKSVTGVSLKDILIGLNLTAPSATKGPARKTVVEMSGKLNDARYKADKSRKMQNEMYKYYDFTLYVNGKAYPLSDATMKNLSSLGSMGDRFWSALYYQVQWDYSRRRVITNMRIKGYAYYLLEMLENALENEPAELTVHILKAMEEAEVDPVKKAFNQASRNLSELDAFTASKVVLRSLRG